MSRTSVASLVLALAAVAAPVASRAQAVIFVHERSIYADQNEGKLKAPEGVACSDNGYVVVADSGNQRLVLYGFKDGRLNGGTEVKLPQLLAPQRVQIDAKGNVLVLDLKSRKIVRVAPDGTYGGVVDPKGIEDAGAVLPASFKVDASGNVYVLDGPGKRVLVLDPNGTVLSQVKLPAESRVVTDIAVGSDGSLLAVDAVDAVVWSAEKGAQEFKALTPSLKDRISFPSYITTQRGRIYLVDQNGNGIVVLGVDGSYQGRQLSIGWNDGLVNYPAQMCLTESGTVFVADRFNNRVQAFSTGR